MILSRSCLATLIAVLFAFDVHLVPAQGLGSLLPGKTTASAQQEDPLKRDTPRSAVRAFLEACHNERYVQASHYLDLENLPVKRRVTEGPEFAKQIADVLDRDAHFELGQLSDAAAGTDPANPNRENLTSISVDGSIVSLYLQRDARPGGGNIWLISQDSVARLPELTTFDQETSFEKKLPSVLVSTRLLDTSVWVWFALVLSAMILSLVSGLLSRIIIRITKAIASYYAKDLNDIRLQAFTQPLRLLLSVIVLRTEIEFLDPSALLRDYLLKILIVLFSLGAGSLVMRIIDLIFDHVRARLSKRERDLTYSVLPLGVRSLKVVVFCIFVLFTLGAWGYNTNAILAGLGVGGLAVALAAQKTIENFFGGVSVITDRPVLVGDYCQFGTQSGTVEDIGLRSTRIRTNDRTLVTIPNGQFSSMTLENFSRRDRIWFHPNIRLRRGTPPEKIPAFMEKITDILKQEELIIIGNTPLRFTKIDDQSLNIEIFVYFQTTDYDKFMQAQTKLLLAFLKAGEEAGVEFAIPVAESITRTN